jgi:hypothetical protein
VVPAGHRVLPVGFGEVDRCAILSEMKQGLYANINARKRAGTSRPKSKSTISPKVWRMMKGKKGGFSESSGK